MIKKKYLVTMNLSGLHRHIYELTYDKSLKEYYDKTGNVSATKSYTDDDLVQLVFNKKRDAVNTLKGAKMVADFLIRRLQ